MAVQAVVVEVLDSLGFVFLWVRQCHAHDRGADWTLQDPLTLPLLPLGLHGSQDILTKLTVEVLNFLFETEPTLGLSALQTDVHLLIDKLAIALTFVVYVWCSEFSETPHF